jgi:SnoaL-like polyketide cyclase
MGNAVDKHREAHKCFNNRDWDGLRAHFADNARYSDVPRGLEMKTGDEFLGWARDWATAFSDATVFEPQYIDGGEYSVCRFTARGTNDGPMGPMQATGNRLDMAFCEVMHWGADGRCDRGEMYYDQMTLLIQMGVVEPPQTG